LIFNRKIYDSLLEWKKSEGKEALLIEGARRIGKSTIVQEFAKKEYESFLLIDFARTSDEIKQYFVRFNNDLNTLFMMLQNVYGVELKERKSLIIFDEVQRFPTAREMIKYLVADGRYDYIETGSLISIRENIKDIVIPSEERALKMYPMDFEEFCIALGNKPIVSYIKDCFEKKVPLETVIHEKAMQLFREYMLVGGMPQAVLSYIDSNKNFGEVDRIKRNILNLYREDIMKIKARYRSRVISIYDMLPALLSKHEKRVVFSNVIEGSFAEQYADTFFWLTDSMIVNECRKTDDPNIAPSLNVSETYLKCYMSDTGLLVSHAFNENEILENEVYKQILLDKLSLNEGMLYENMIAQMLTANGHKLFFYTRYNEEKHRNDIEIDFLISNNSKLTYKTFPIEVKSGKKYTIKSLTRFKEKYSKRIGGCYIIHPKNLSIKDDILCIPPYMTICL
jgi:predicted AAA+ superfamily ATPase